MAEGGGLGKRREYWEEDCTLGHTHDTRNQLKRGHTFAMCDLSKRKKRSMLRQGTLVLEKQKFSLNLSPGKMALIESENEDDDDSFLQKSDRKMHIEEEPAQKTSKPGLSNRSKGSKAKDSK